MVREEGVSEGERGCSYGMGESEWGGGGGCSVGWVMGWVRVSGGGGGCSVGWVRVEGGGGGGCSVGWVRVEGGGGCSVGWVMGWVRVSRVRM